MDLPRQAVPLAAVAGGAGGDDVLPDGFAAAGAGDHVVDGEAGFGRAAVLAGPGVAGEDGAAGDLAAVRLAGDADEICQADDVGVVHRHVLGMEDGAVAALEEFGLLLQQQHSGPSQRADVDGLESRV